MEVTKGEPAILAAIRSNGVDAFMNALNDVWLNLDKPYVASDNIPMLHPTNSLGHHAAVAFAWYMVCWVLFAVALIICRTFGSKDFLKNTLKSQCEVALLVMCYAHHAVTCTSILYSMFVHCGIINLVTCEKGCLTTYRPRYS